MVLVTAHEGSVTVSRFHTRFLRRDLTIGETERGECFLLVSIKQGEHPQLERWSWTGKDWQSQLIATLPKLESEEDFLFVIWTGNGLIVVDERRLPLVMVSFHHSVREVL